VILVRVVTPTAVASARPPCPMCHRPVAGRGMPAPTRLAAPDALAAFED